LRQNSTNNQDLSEPDAATVFDELVVRAAP